MRKHLTAASSALLQAQALVLRLPAADPEQRTQSATKRYRNALVSIIYLYTDGTVSEMVPCSHVVPSVSLCSTPLSD